MLTAGPSISLQLELLDFDNFKFITNKQQNRSINTHNYLAYVWELHLIYTYPHIFIVRKESHLINGLIMMYAKKKRIQKKFMHHAETKITA